MNRLVGQFHDTEVNMLFHWQSSSLLSGEVCYGPVSIPPLVVLKRECVDKMIFFRFDSTLDDVSHEIHPSRWQFVTGERCIASLYKFVADWQFSSVPSKEL